MKRNLLAQMHLSGMAQANTDLPRYPRPTGKDGAHYSLIFFKS